MAEQMSRPDAALPASPFLSRLLPAAMIYWLVTAGLTALVFLPKANDLIGPDNDDVMRLVEVRDLLGGQGWFDLMQYRLGLDGGTLMHWSRLIDAPIGALIRLFSMFMPVSTAEGVAASLWPLLVSAPLFVALGLAGRRLGGPRAMHIALGLGALFVFTCGKFHPGALDHHNVQLALAMGIAAALADRKANAAGHAAAGMGAALAIAIGAETVPFVAVACLCVAARWIWQGAPFSAAARAFGLSLSLSITAIFVATVPPHAYAAITCDSLSLGFYSLAALGGTGFFALACLPAKLPFLARIAVAGALGALLLITAVVVAPQCLGSPLAGLDPMLLELWLKDVTEARSLLDQIRVAPHSVGGFYAAGLGAMMICVFRIWKGEERGVHLLFLALIAACWGISVVQVRGAYFANLLSIPPFALLISDLQQRVRENSKDIPATLGFVVVTLAGVPAVWALGGALWHLGVTSVNIDMLSTDTGEEAGECDIAANAAELGAISPGLVAAPSNSGADILRFTQHRVLSAPYHRNQGGMLTELHIGMAKPDEAQAFLKGAGVTVVAFCKADPQTANIIGLKRDGLYAALARGEVPAYLTPAGGEDKGLRLYVINPKAAD